ncbi:Xaa-Pro dipeptidase [Congregibacter sp.]|uniref:Xaa-Pro dipeptidase n=1 Tax=Congregibacter sp. TaxID=2744308 RepID=UPI003F6BE0C8
MSLNKPSAVALLSGLLACSTLGPSAQAEQLLLSADYMVDTLSGELVPNPAVLISDGVIEAVGTRGELAAPEGATEMHLKGKTLLPGFMDMHVHLDGSVGDVSFLESRFQSVPRKTVNAVVNARTTLMAGFTSVRNVGAMGDYSVIAVRDSIKGGELMGPRIWDAGPSLGITGGHCDDNFSPPEQKKKNTGVANGPWAVREKVRENIKYGADTIKFCATGGVFSRGTKVGAIQYSLEEMQAIVSESHYRDLVVAAHAHGTEGIKAAIIAGVDSVEHASMLDDEAIELALEHGTYLSMDIYNTEYTLSMGRANGVPEENLRKEESVGQVQRDSFSAAVKAGVKMVFGSDASIYPHGLNARQFSRMVKFGMTEMQALQAATINSATLMKQDDLGAIKAGYLADIVAVEGNPLEDISITESVPFVMKGGVVYKNL